MRCGSKLLPAALSIAAHIVLPHASISHLVISSFQDSTQGLPGTSAHQRCTICEGGVCLLQRAAVQCSELHGTQLTSVTCSKYRTAAVPFELCVLHAAASYFGRPPVGM
jgi:hypothetical protein